MQKKIDNSQDKLNTNFPCCFVNTPKVTSKQTVTLEKMRKHSSKKNHIPNQPLDRNESNRKMISKVNERCTGIIKSTDTYLDEIDDHEQSRTSTVLPERKFRNIPSSHTENYNDYENFDAQEEAIYQNMIFSNGKSFPECRSTHGEASYLSRNEKLHRSPENKQSRKNSSMITYTTVRDEKKQIQSSVTNPKNEKVNVQV